MRLEAEEEGRCRELLACPTFCCVREDCGREVLGPGLAAPRGALKVPIRGEGAKTGDPALEALVLKEKVNNVQTGGVMSNDILLPSRGSSSIRCAGSFLLSTILVRGSLAAGAAGRAFHSCAHIHHRWAIHPPALGRNTLLRRRVIGPRLSRICLAGAARFLIIRINVSPALFSCQNSLTTRFAAAGGFSLEGLRQIRPVDHSFPTRPFSRCGLCSGLVGIGPMRKATQTSFLADLIGNVGEHGIQPNDLAVQLFIRIGNDVVLLVSRHHEVGKVLSHAIEEEPAVFTLGRLGGLGELLQKGNRH